MSTVPEVIVARHMNVPVFAISVITDLGIDGKIIEVSHEEVQKAATKKITIILMTASRGTETNPNEPIQIQTRTGILKKNMEREI